MSGRRRVVAGLALAAAGTADAWTRPTRATREERRALLPGDELVPHPLWQATRATTVRAPRAAVWPWLVQMGYPTLRAGWYIPVWIDRLLFGIRAPSADTIRPELQGLEPGDRVPDSPDGAAAWFTAVRVDREAALVLLSHTHPLPLYRDAAFSWSFVLADVPAGSRLVMRARVTCTPRGPARVVRALIRLLFTAGDVVQAGAMLRGIRARVEATAVSPPLRTPLPPSSDRTRPPRQGGPHAAARGPAAGR